MRPGMNGNPNGGPGNAPNPNDPMTGSLAAPHSLFWDDILPLLSFGLVSGGSGLAANGWGAGAGAATDAMGPSAGGFTPATAPTTGADALASGYGAIAGPSAGDVAGGLSPALAAGGWTTERIAKLALSLGIPAATLIQKLNANGGGGGGSNGVPGPFGAQINDTLGLMNDRLRSTVPVHDAAMQLAMKMAAPSTPDPALLASASNAVRAPVPTMQPSPQVAAAAAALAKHFGG